VSADLTRERLEPFILKVGIVVALGTIMSTLDTTIVTVAIGSISQSFRVSVSTIQWVTTGYLLALGIVIPASGWSIHRLGAKRVYMSSLVLFIAGSALCGLAWSSTSLICFRVLQGLGGGMLVPVGQTILARAAGPHRLGRVMGLIGIPMVFGPILGPLIGGAIVTHFSWRWIFLVNVPFGIVAVIASLRVLPRSERDRTHRFDFLGFLLLSPGLALLLYGLSQVGKGGGYFGASVQVSLTGGLALCALFVWRSLRAPEPLIDVRLFGDRHFTAASIGAFLVSATIYGVMFLLPLYYELARGRSPWIAGLMMTPQGIGGALSQQPAGAYVDRHGPKLLLPLGMGLVTLGTFAYTEAGGSMSYAILAAALFVRGIGFGMASTPLIAVGYRGLSHDQIPRATTAQNISRQVGGSMGVAFIAVVLQNQLATRFPRSGGNVAAISHHLAAAARQRLAGAFTVSFRWSLAICAVGVIPLLFLKQGRLADHSPSTPSADELADQPAG
jgi:EmrB/QacA subfamily drug resistance transporter